MIEKMGEVEKEDPTHPIGGDSIMCFEVQECSCIRSREEFPGTELTEAQKVKTKIEGTQTCSDDFLEEFTMTLQEGDWAIGFRKRIIGFLGFRDDHHFSLAPGIEAELKGGIPQEKAGVWRSVKSPMDQRVGDTGRARSQRRRGALQSSKDFRNRN